VDAQVSVAQASACSVETHLDAFSVKHASIQIDTLAKSYRVLALYHKNMRTTKVYSITMPPEMAKQAERLAKKENRTMSELMREALRRYQQPSVVLDVREYIRQLAPTPPPYQAIREDARRKGSDKLSMQQIDREVAAVRQRRGKKTNKNSGK
jgi:Arc/MetJ-type ribon-helix-helix transcriptional regulator